MPFGIPAIEIGRKIDVRSMSGASRKIQSSICQITRLGWRSIAAASTKLCSRELDPVIDSFSERTPSDAVDVALPEMDGERGAHEDGVELWLRIRPAFCIRAVRRIHRGEQTRRPKQLQRIDHEIERRRHRMMAALAHEKTHEIVAAMVMRSCAEPEIDEFTVLLEFRECRTPARRPRHRGTRAASAAMPQLLADDPFS